MPALLFLLTYLAKLAWIFEVLTSFQFLLFWCLLISFAGLALLRQWKCAIPVAVVLALSTYATFSIFLPIGNRANSSNASESIRICSFNVLHNNENFAEMIEAIRQADPDIIILIEYTSRWKAHLVELEEEYPYQIVNPRRLGSGIAVYSRIELKDTRVFQLTRDVHDCPMIRTRMRLGGKDVNLFAVHTLSPRVPEYMEIRNRQLKELEEIINDYSGTKIVAGDFNATPWSPYLKEFMGQTGLKDSRQGFGQLATWPAGIWLARVPIDHMFVTSDVRTESRGMIRIQGSDHMAITGQFSVDEK